MYKLNLPDFSPQTRQQDGRTEIFCTLRSRYVALTPEEWVRQCFVNFLTTHLGYHRELMANEVTLRVGIKTVRADTVIYSRSLIPRMIIEYKAPTVALTEKTFYQTLAYNSLLHVEYIVMSNGLQHIYCHIDYVNNRIEMLKNPPSWPQLQGKTEATSDATKVVDRQ